MGRIISHQKSEHGGKEHSKKMSYEILLLSFTINPYKLAMNDQAIPMPNLSSQQF